MYDIISIGDTTVDVFLELDEATVQCDLDKENCRLCVNYADKVPVKSVTTVNAVGNAANNAVGMARLGNKAALVSIVGEDKAGKDIYHILKKEKVSIRYVRKDKAKRTNFSTVLNFRGERTILVYHEHRTYRWQKIPKSRWLYFTSMGQGHEIMFDDLISHVKKSKTKLAFNPGTFQLKLGREKLLPVLAMTDVLFLNKEEGGRIAGDSEDILALMRQLSSYGPKFVVVTDGQKGSYCFDGTKQYFCPIFDAPIVERTGCGDAYASGFMGALVYGHSVEEAMRWGSVNAAGVLQHIGAQKGLQTRAQIERQLKKYPEFQPREI